MDMPDSTLRQRSQRPQRSQRSRSRVTLLRALSRVEEAPPISLARFFDKKIHKGCSVPIQKQGFVMIASVLEHVLRSKLKKASKKRLMP